MSVSKSSLLQIIEDQKVEIERYKIKLRDVVTAHRGVLKEKEALEESFKAIRNQQTDDNVAVGGVTPHANETEDAKQIAALVNSLTTISAEKSRIELSFQTDNKQLREEKEVIEKQRNELSEKIIGYESEIEDLKSKLIIERHERDKEQSDHGAIMKELQSLLASERTSRLELEAKVTELRKRLNESGNVSLAKYEKRVERLQNEADMARRRLELSEKKNKEPPRELFKLKDEIRNLQIEHQTAMQQERDRALEVEHRAKKQGLIQEERVMNLETRLAELSATVGSYHRLRQQDQSEILKLKDYIAALNIDHLNMSSKELANPNEKDKISLDTVDSNKHKELEETVEVSREDVHKTCVEELTRLTKELNDCKEEIQKKKQQFGKQESIEVLVKSLQERIRLLNEEVASKENQKQIEVEKLKQQIRFEKSRFKETLSAAETDYRGRLNLLETQLQKLRERSLALLEDKDQEIHSLQGTFQTFLPGARINDTPDMPSLTTMRDGPRMLHYANELARRDVDIAALRRTKHKLEATLRELQRAAVADTEKHREERQSLREEIARLERSQTREGANMEYLKNVVLNFVLSNDPFSKRHMCNAIAAVLKFTDAEQDKIGKQSHNNWWVAGKS